MDSQFSFTNIAIANFKPLDDLTQLFPNPASEQLIVTDLPAGTQLRLLNTNGQLLRTYTVNADRQEILLLDLPNGW